MLMVKIELGDKKKKTITVIYVFLDRNVRSKVRYKVARIHSIHVFRDNTKGQRQCEECHLTNRMVEIGLTPL